MTWAHLEYSVVETRSFFLYLETTLGKHTRMRGIIFLGFKLTRWKLVVGFQRRCFWPISLTHKTWNPNTPYSGQKHGSIKFNEGKCICNDFNTNFHPYKINQKVLRIVLTKVFRNRSISYCEIFKIISRNLKYNYEIKI